MATVLPRLLARSICATEPPEGRKGAVLVVLWGGLAGRGQISKARLLGHGTHPKSPPVLRQGEEMRRERVFDFMSRFSRNFPGRNFLYLKNMGDCAADRPIVDVGERRCILKLDQKSKKSMAAPQHQRHNHLLSTPCAVTISS